MGSINKITSKTLLTFLFLGIILVLNSCCFSAKEVHLGNNIYLSEFDNVDRRIFYQKESCATTADEIVPMTVLEVSHNSNWIIAKSGNKRGQTNFKYWVIKNSYDQTPDSKTVIENTIEFDDYKLYESYLTNNNIDLKLKKID